MIDAFFETFRLLFDCSHETESSVRFDTRSEKATGKWCQKCGSVFVADAWYRPSIVGLLHVRRELLLGAVRDLADVLAQGSEAAIELEDAMEKLGHKAGALAGELAEDVARLGMDVRMMSDAAGIWFDEASRVCRRVGVHCQIRAVGTEGRARALAPLVDESEGDAEPPPEAPSEPTAPACSDAASAPLLVAAGGRR